MADSAPSRLAHCETQYFTLFIRCHTPPPPFSSPYGQTSLAPRARHSFRIDLLRMNVSRLVSILLLVVVTITARVIRLGSSEVPSTMSSKQADVDTRVRYCSRRFYDVVKVVCGHCYPGTDISLATICCNEGCRYADVRKGCCPELAEPKI